MKLWFVYYIKFIKNKFNSLNAMVLYGRLQQYKRKMQIIKNY